MSQFDIKDKKRMSVLLCNEYIERGRSFCTKTVLSSVLMGSTVVATFHAKLTLLTL